MSLVLEPTQSVPLVMSADGVIRVAGTRVTLDAVAAAFRDGATAEEIVQRYPSLPLAEVYAALGYLLRHEAEVAEYLEHRAGQRDAAKASAERRHAPHGIRARLLARRTAAASL